MANRRSFKTDESFLEKLAIGAIGARAVFEALKRQGHRPIGAGARFDELQDLEASQNQAPSRS
jgi:hypothetical protein